MRRIPPSCLAVAALLSLHVPAPGQEPEPGQIPPLPPLLPHATPAFPGAWGGGMYTVGGRGGRVLLVESLADDGPGSLRAAVEAGGPRTVVFRVAGIIRLKSALDITSPFITIAGQSAPGDGIGLAHDSVNIDTHEVILRHLRVRRGLAEGGQGSDNIGGNPEGQVIVDHGSTSWGMHENLSLYRCMKEENGRSVKHPTRNVTVQFCISSEALDARNHAFGGTWGGEDSTFHHNLFACNTAFEAWPIHQETASRAFATVLARAGATLPRRDAVDRRSIESVRTGKVSTPTGIIESPGEVGGYPGYAFDAASVPADGDRDGMPDAWERRHGLDPEDAADAGADGDRDGYTSLEEFLNGTDPTELIDYIDLRNNVDTISG